eukprot:TRINITY_DN47905_c0_g1_i1.p1 TRINITY_DN47905_c0_g1~~TRINITY_DN47905_c0_g1_i1.p1  ORF type:complete len:482 (+),score=286.86 TRINITY_DN47905_c0_g1_i1:102-1547(+)
MSQSSSNSKSSSKSSERFVEEFVEYLNASPSPFHAVAQAVQRLEAAGFNRIDEADSGAFAALKPGDKFYLTRNQSSIMAFAVGGKYEKGNPLSVTVGHTDSPCLRVKPVSKKVKSGFLQVGVETYGGLLAHTWFDHDLSVAGRVVVANEDCTAFESRLVRIERPILRIGNLAIHLNREVSSKGFHINRETHLEPMLATQARAQLEGDIAAEESKRDGDDKGDGNTQKHHALLIRLLAEELGVKPEQVRDFELSLYDTQQSRVGGAYNEFIFSARLDNLMGTFTCLQALLTSLEDGSLANDSSIRVFAAFDHEEVGSVSAQGAASNMMRTVLRRICGGDYDSSIRRSMVVSVDCAHAVHPNYSEKHEANHRPGMNAGLVVKNNTNQRYATNAISSFIIREVARRHNIPVQNFVIRQDQGCGSTVGPMLSANSGVRTIDVGAPIHSMHSIRECGGTADVAYSIDLLSAFYREYAELNANVKVD